MKICAARKHLEEIKYLLSSHDYDAALASIVEAADKVANTAATYGAFMKDKEKHKACLEPIVFELPETVVTEEEGAERNSVLECDANYIIGGIKGDILYLDPPYNTRQYGSNYHVLNGIVTLDIQDKDSSTGVPKNYKRSEYCSKRTAKTALEKLINTADFEWIFLSYNNEEYFPLRI
jgi:adenine-specific DNA-methyltransferase